MEPGNSDRISFPEVRHAGPELRDDAGGFVARDERQGRPHRPIPLRRMKVGMAHTAGHHLDQDFARPGFGYRDLLNGKRLAEFRDHRGSHRTGHG